MPTLELSIEQAKILQPGSLGVEACPGAGKTRAIAKRFIERPGGDGRGVALLSFTNRAVIEARSRFMDHPHLTKSPNFVGTFDSFLNRFVVTPHYVRTNGRSPLFVSSWNEFNLGDVSVRISRGPGVELDHFVLGGARPALCSLDRLSWTEKNYLKSIEHIPDSVNRLESMALSKIHGFIQSGVLDSAASRYYANKILESNEGPTVLSRLAQRFNEIIVDEFQDCDSNEYAIIQHLETSGIVSVVVADPDQGIFEFRGADPSLFSDYVTRLQPERHLVFTVNYRSTAAICSLASSLRADSSSRVSPCDVPPKGPSTIFLLVGTAAEQRKKFLAIAVQFSILPQDCIALANTWKNAANLAGTVSTSNAGNAKCDMILHHVARLTRAGSSIEDRIEAIAGLERIVLSAFAWPVVLANANVSDQLAVLQKTRDWLRVVAARILRSVIRTDDHDRLSEAVRSVLSREVVGLTIPTVDLSRNFTKPSTSSWNNLSRRGEGSFLHSSIHSAKGSERNGVLLHIPPRSESSDVLDDWELGRNTERRRLLYVGATRARQLLALAIMSDDLPAITRVLTRDSVNFTVE